MKKPKLLDKYMTILKSKIAIQQLKKIKEKGLIMCYKENSNKKETKKQLIVDEKLRELERKERENYRSRSWKILTSDGFYPG